MLALFGISFLTPLNALFVLAAAIPLAALLATERRARRIRRALAAAAPSRRALLGPTFALVLLPALVAVAAAQPVVVHQQFVKQRADAEAFFVLDTSLSMNASGGPGRPTRLVRAKRLALRLRATLPDLPVGLVSMTDRALPDIMPTVDTVLFNQALAQSVAIDQPPPSQPYRGRATSFTALTPFVASGFFAPSVERRVIVVFTDGESQPLPSYFSATIEHRMTPIFVHVWKRGERIYRSDGRPERGYFADPASAGALANAAQLMGGSAFDESQLGQVAKRVRAAVGYAQAQTQVEGYARVALAPWFVLAGVLPLGFLLWRRNV
ncbi:MAG: vWA domain-containing protein [Gaiellaceae bacterium]